MGRMALATFPFDVNQAALPFHIRVDRATKLVWGNEAVSFIRRWRFRPAGGMEIQALEVN